MPNDIYGDIDAGFIEQSLCKDCDYRISREIKPLESAIEFWEESLGIEINDETILETHTCILLGMDLDHIVINCNKYKSNNPENPENFINNISKIKK